MRGAILLLLTVAGLGVAGCEFPATRMEPASAYGARERPTFSAAPAYTAGPTEQLTYSPDGSTRFVCAGGGSMRADRVPPGAVPAC